MNVYPNPTSNIVNIDTDEQLSNYIIYDVSGRQIQSHLFTGSNQINLQNVTTGVYFIKVITVQGNSGTVKVVKDRKSTRLNSSHVRISYAVFCLKKKI